MSFVTSGFVSTTLKALRAATRGVARSQKLRRDYLQLSAMSDPELQDIGIGRSDIFAVIERTYLGAARSLITRQKRTLEAGRHLSRTSKVPVYALIPTERRSDHS